MDNIEKHKQICAELTDVYTAKNADYGDSFHKSFEKYGLVLAAVRMEDKINRFSNLSKLYGWDFSINGAEAVPMVKTESIRDTLLDLANYAIMTVTEIDGIEEETGGNDGTTD